MAILEPALAAAMADAVYEIKDSTNTRIVADRFKNELTIAPSSRLTATSGSFLVIKNTTGFVLAAPGINRLENDVVIMFRGTASIFDGLTDAHVGFTPSPCGTPVHAGFMNCFDTLQLELLPFFVKYNKPINTIHCVGHSLGGALATIAASWMLQNKFAPNLKLYTFGSPRVGSGLFSGKLTRNMGADNLYRVNHKTDPVAMIPIWPFSHVPDPGRHYYINTPGSCPNPAFHKMSTYIESVNNKTWNTMKDLLPPVDDSAIEQWLGSKGLVNFSTNSISMISCGITYLLKKILLLTGITIQIGLSTSFTLLDQLAKVLEKGAGLSKDIAGWVKSLAVKMMQALGIVVTDTLDITSHFLRYILNQFSSAVYAVARGAVNLAHNIIS